MQQTYYITWEPTMQRRLKGIISDETVKELKRIVKMHNCTCYSEGGYLKIKRYGKNGIQPLFDVERLILAERYTGVLGPILNKMKAEEERGFEFYTTNAYAYQGLVLRVRIMTKAERKHYTK